MLGITKLPHSFEGWRCSLFFFGRMSIILLQRKQLWYCNGLIAVTGLKWALNDGLMGAGCAGRSRRSGPS